MRGIVTVTDAGGRELWTGTCYQFDHAFWETLSVAEFCELYRLERLEIGFRDGHPPRTIKITFVTVH